MNAANPNDYVAVGQSFEENHEPGTLFTVTSVQRRWSERDKAEFWHIVLMCVVSPWAWFRPGATSEVVSRDGTLRSNGYTRIG